MAVWYSGVALRALDLHRDRVRFPAPPLQYKEEREMEISKLFELRRLDRGDAVRYIRMQPEDVYDLIDGTCDWIVEGSGKRIERALT